jgi:hypothetical protein
MGFSAGDSPRLRTSCLLAATLPGGAPVVLYNTSAAVGTGAIAFVGFNAASPGNMSYLAGPLSLTIGGSGGVVVPLGFSTESFFLTGEGLQTSTYTTPVAAITALDAILSHKVIAWRSFQFDPLVWSSSATLVWQPPEGSGPITLTSTVFAYEWPAAGQR